MKRLGFATVVFLAGLVLAVGWWKHSLSPVDNINRSTKTFVVNKGDGVKEISVNLKNAGLIRDQVSFFLLERFFIKNSPQAGNFQLSPSMSAQEVAEKLTVGTQDVWVTIPEGWRSEEIKDFLIKKLPAIAADPMFKTVSWREYEGKLFPDTYLVPTEIGSSKFLGLMLENFSQKVNFPVTQEQLIIASMVEREARREQDRPLVASVITNRLEIGMKLDIDATVQYAVGQTQKDGWWKQELTIDDLAIKSLYNTYTNPGLPPGPICNPGLSAISAAANPAKSDYLYYVADKKGITHFARSLEEHNANIAKYLQ